MLSVFSLYPTYRIFVVFLVSLVLTMVALPFWIRILRHREVGQQVRADGPQGHLVKQGTPTMGGLVILVMMALSVFVAGFPSPALILLVAATLLTGVLGFIDDISKVVKKRSLGLTPLQKMIAQTIIAIAFCLLAVNWIGISPIVTIPIANYPLDLGVWTTIIPIGNGISIPWLYVIFVFLLIAGFSNAVNLTDGLDGLAGGTVMVVMLVMAGIAFSLNQGDVALFAVAAAGACVGFLWFNCYPASIFMGDTGSLALGTAFAGLAVLTKTEVFSIIIGGLFVAEACSVIIQVVYYHFKKKRIFLMAPLHHHYEKKGWSEPQVVIRFWIISGLLAGLGFALFFLGSM